VKTPKLALLAFVTLSVMLAAAAAVYLRSYRTGDYFRPDARGQRRYRVP
jgi:hypothetical protein